MKRDSQIRGEQTKTIYLLEAVATTPQPIVYDRCLSFQGSCSCWKVETRLLLLAVLEDGAKLPLRLLELADAELPPRLHLLAVVGMPFRLLAANDEMPRPLLLAWSTAKLSANGSPFKPRHGRTHTKTFY